MATNPPFRDEDITGVDLPPFEDMQAGQSESASTQMGPRDPFWGSMGPNFSNLSISPRPATIFPPGPDPFGYFPSGTAQMNDPFYYSAYQQQFAYPSTHGAAGFNVPSDPGFNVPSGPGFNAPSGPGFNAPSDPGFNVPSGPGFNAPSDPGFNVPSGPGFNVPSGPGFNVPSGPGFNVPSTPGHHFTPYPTGPPVTNPSQRNHIRSPSSYSGMFIDSSRPLQGPSPHQIALGNPLLRLRPGQYIEPVHSAQTDPMGSGGDRAREPVRDAHASFADVMEAQSMGQHRLLTEEQTALGGLDLNTFKMDEILFNFGVICIMGNLNPEFQYQWSDDKTKIGMRLTVYGHTIVIDANWPSAHICRVLGCQRALMKMRKYNPQWLTAPLPTDVPTRPEWNWVKILQGKEPNTSW